jgi:hypothetical protein
MYLFFNQVTVESNTCIDEKKCCHVMLTMAVNTTLLCGRGHIKKVVEEQALEESENY